MKKYLLPIGPPTCELSLYTCSSEAEFQAWISRNYLLTNLVIHPNSYTIQDGLAANADRHGDEPRHGQASLLIHVLQGMAAVTEETVKDVVEGGQFGVVL